MMYGARSLIVAAVAVFIAAVSGWGSDSWRFLRGWMTGLMGLTNFFLSFTCFWPSPSWGSWTAHHPDPGPGLTSWPFTRIIRSEVLTIKELEFVEAAGPWASGNRDPVQTHHPSVLNSILVTASLETARMIINEAFFSFLGLGVQPPSLLGEYAL
jgi:hypothetical protein